MAKDYYKRVRAVCDYLMEDNNFGVRIPETNEKLIYLGFDKLMDEMKESDSFDAEPYLVLIDMLDRTGQDILTNAEERHLRNARENPDIKMPTDKSYQIYLDQFLSKGTFMKVHILLNRLNNYKSKSTDLTKEQWSKENNLLKYILGDKSSSNMKIAKTNWDNLGETEVDKEDIMNPVKVEFRTRTIHTMGYDKNHIETLAVPTTPAYFKQSFTGHIPVFVHMLLEGMMSGGEDIFYKAISGLIDEKATLMFLFLEIERRLMKEKSIIDYLKPVYEVNMIVENNYIVGRVNADTLFVVYKCDGVLLVQDKYVDKVLLPKGVSLNDEGVLITYSNNKPLWEKVFPIYKPKGGNYNWISDVNRAK